MNNDISPVLISGVACYERDGTAYLRLEDVARGRGTTNKEVNYMRPTLTINETLSLKRKAGMRASYWDEVTGLESGRYPYGHTTRAARPDGSQGRRIVRIYRADLEAWIKSKEANNAV